jgi:hypothetical protein
MEIGCSAMVIVFLKKIDSFGFVTSFLKVQIRRAI